MINAQTIRKGAFFIGVTSLIFTIVAGIVNYLYLDMTILNAPTYYLYYAVLVQVLPYLFVAIISLIVTVLANNFESSPPKKEPVELSKRDFS
jgi:uncharacterized membrane protein